MAKPPATVFGKRLREARERIGLPQDKLGVLIGLDEGTASARISRYETGVHEPGFETAKRIAQILEIPVAYLYCPEDDLARIILAWQGLSKAGKRRAEAGILGS